MIVFSGSYKIVEGTSLAVDAFRYGDIENVEHYFLSHFHADHYIGLKKSFCHKLYVSNITGLFTKSQHIKSFSRNQHKYISLNDVLNLGRLVVELIKVQEQYVHCLDINVPIIVDDVEVTLLDANQ